MLRNAPIPSDERAVASNPHHGMDKLVGEIQLFNCSGCVSALIPSDERVVGLYPTSVWAAGFDSAVLHWLLLLGDPGVAIGQCR